MTTKKVLPAVDDEKLVEAGEKLVESMSRTSADPTTASSSPPPPSLARHASHSELEQMAVMALTRLHSEGAPSKSSTSANSSSALQPPSFASAVSDTYVSAPRMTKRMRGVGEEPSKNKIRRRAAAAALVRSSVVVIPPYSSSAGGTNQTGQGQQKPPHAYMQQTGPGPEHSQPYMMPSQNQTVPPPTGQVQQTPSHAYYQQTGPGQQQPPSNPYNMTNSNQKVPPGANPPPMIAPGNVVQPGHFYHTAVFPLSTPEDKQRLTKFLCFVRRELVEVYCATEADVKVRYSCKRITLGQVGIRCKHCASFPYKSRYSRSCSYPTSLSRIYQSLTMMIRDHFGQCIMIPKPLRDTFAFLKKDNKQSHHDAMRYWVESATTLGLVDTTNGIRMASTLSDQDVMLETKLPALGRGKGNWKNSPTYNDHNKGKWSKQQGKAILSTKSSTAASKLSTGATSKLPTAATKSGATSHLPRSESPPSPAPKPAPKWASTSKPIPPPTGKSIFSTGKTSNLSTGESILTGLRAEMKSVFSTTGSHKTDFKLSSMSHSSSNNNNNNNKSQDKNKTKDSSSGLDDFMV